MTKLVWLIPMLFLFSCDTGRVYEKNLDLEEGLWLRDSIQYFRFEVVDASLDYNVYVNIRNEYDYAFYNLYYQYVLSDSSGNVLNKKLENIHLFHPKTGEPFGEGLGDVFDHRQSILDHFKFPDSGEYTFSMQQFMRKDSLPKLLSVGVRVERASFD